MTIKQLHLTLKFKHQAQRRKKRIASADYSFAQIKVYGKNNKNMRLNIDTKRSDKHGIILEI